MRWMILGMFLLLLGSTTVAQDTLNSKRVDQKTLHYYYQKEWKPLITLGRKARRQNIDFKYLRYRMGIAHYELGNYNYALPHFKAAEKQTLQDTILEEYLYYSYLLGGREADARLYAGTLDAAGRKRLGFQLFRWVDEAHLTVGAKFSDLTDSVGHMPFVTVGLSHQLGTRFKYSHHFTFLSQNYQGLQYNQYEYYGKAELALYDALQLYAAMHFTGMRGRSLFSNGVPMGELRFEQNVQQTGTIALFGLQGNIGALQWKAYGSYSDWVAKTTTTGRFSPLFPPPPGAPLPPDTTFFEQTVDEVWQYGIDLNYRVGLSQTQWLSFGGHVSLQHQGKVINPIWGVRAYGQITPKMGLELEFLQANATYFLVNDAAFVSNTIENLNAQVGLTFNYQISPKWNWYVNYTYENRQSNNFNFNYHILFTGLKFRL